MRIISLDAKSIPAPLFPMLNISFLLLDFISGIFCNISHYLEKIKYYSRIKKSVAKILKFSVCLSLKSIIQKIDHVSVPKRKSMNIPFDKIDAKIQPYGLRYRITPEIFHA